MAMLRQALNREGLPAKASPIAVCCVCRLLRARKTVVGEADRWITKRAFEHLYGVRVVGTPVTHTYCSGCHTDFMQRVRPSGRTLSR